MTLHYYFF